MNAANMPPNTIVAGANWVAIKEEFPRDRRFVWGVAGSGVPSATNENIDELIERGLASVIRPCETTLPDPTC